MKIEKDPVSGIVCLVTEEACRCPCHKPGNTAVLHFFDCCQDGVRRNFSALVNVNMPREVFKKINAFLADNIDKIQP